MKRRLYHADLRKLDEWEPYLLEHSGLPGPRANIELAQAVADEASSERLLAYAKLTPQQAPANTSYEFPAFCGVIGLGRLLADGDADAMPALRRLAADPRTRTREAVALALRRLGDRDMDRLLRDLDPWVHGNPYEQGAAIAAICEQALLRNPRHARAVLGILDQLTASIPAAYHRPEEFRVLRKAPGYCWSVAVVAHPDDGKSLVEKWCDSDDPDIVRVMRENLNKARMVGMDAQWVLDVRRKYGH